MTDLPPLPPLPDSVTSSTTGWTAKDWLSERILFGLLILGGYIGLLVFVGLESPLGSAAGAPQLQTIRDGLLVLGPVVGMIAQAIWKTDKSDKQNSDTLAKMAQTPTTTTVSIPPVTSTTTTTP